MKYLIVVAVLIMAGCATRWNLNGASQNQFSRDDAECSLFANSMSSGQGGYYAGAGAASGRSNLAATGGAMAGLELANVGLVYDQCMRARGYTRAR